MASFSKKIDQHFKSKSQVPPSEDLLQPRNLHIEKNKNISFQNEEFDHSNANIANNSIQDMSFTLNTQILDQAPSGESPLRIDSMLETLDENKLGENQGQPSIDGFGFGTKFFNESVSDEKRSFYPRGEEEKFYKLNQLMNEPNSKKPFCLTINQVSTLNEISEDSPDFTSKHKNAYKFNNYGQEESIADKERMLTKNPSPSIVPLNLNSKRLIPFETSAADEGFLKIN